MPLSPRQRLGLASAFFVACAAALFLLLGEEGRAALLTMFRQFGNDGERLRATVLAQGGWAPLLFVGIQALQVVLFPIPGEASGFVGGYLFGAWGGFFYSTLGLTAGSLLAFGISSMFRDAILPRMYPTKIYHRFNHLVAKGDFVIPLLLFLLPGFPKDSLCYLLGLSLMPWRIFLVIAAVGRLPGTLMLSFQGAQVSQGNFVLLLLLFLASLVIGLPFYLYRRKILHWLVRLGGKHHSPEKLPGQPRPADERGETDGQS